MSVLVDAPGIRAAYLEACRLDVAALKPGNVHFFAPGHGMEVSHFLESAQVTAPFIADERMGIGSRVRHSVEATFAAVGCNTNLGILLLAAPLAAAAGRNLASRDMTERLVDVLATLDHEDASEVFKAIARANPAGLGKVEGEMDVHTEPPASVTLLEAMRAAAPRDLIAAEYASGFDLVVKLCRDSYRPLVRDGLAKEHALGCVFMHELAGRADTHIARKHGHGAAERVRREAEALLSGLEHHPSMAWSAPGIQARLLDFDRRLKSAELNPGSLADLMVGVAFLFEISERARIAATRS